MNPHVRPQHARPGDAAPERHRIGIDLGGTKIEGIALAADGSERARVRIPTEQARGYDHILDRIERVYRDMRAAIGEAPHTFGIGTPGAISPRSGRMRNSNTLCLNGRTLHLDLEARLQRAVAIQNDANCFAMAEALLGAGAGHRLVFGVIMGTGCGGGLVIDGAVHTGRTAIAGEWGHMSIDPAGPACYCGQRGCVETLISGGGLEARYAEQYGERAALRAIVSACDRGEPRAVAFMQRFFGHFGRAMANLINILDPDIVVLGGGVSNIPGLYTHGVEAVRQVIFSDYLDTPIVQHTLGDSAGVIGAALIGI